MRFLAGVVLALASVAWAGPKQLALPVGHSTTVSMASTVSKVKVTDPARVEVKKEGRKVTFVAKATGTTEVVVVTADGETRFKIYVAADKYGLPY